MLNYEKKTGEILEARLFLIVNPFVEGVAMGTVTDEVLPVVTEVPR